MNASRWVAAQHLVLSPHGRRTCPVWWNDTCGNMGSSG